MIRMNKHFFCLIFAFAMLSLACSCRKDEPVRKSGTKRIVANVEVFETKSTLEDNAPGVFVSRRVIGTVDGFELTEYVYKNNTLSRNAGLDPASLASGDSGSGPGMTGSSQATKGTVVTTDNIDSFGMLAYAEGQWYDNTIKEGDPGSSTNKNPAGQYFSATVSKSSGTWTISGSPNWINNVPITFWSWKYAEPTRTATNTANFSYTVKSNVSQQEDPVFAFNNETRRFNDAGEIQDGKDEKFNIHFLHALSTVQFLEDDGLEGYRISKIEIQNVNSHTECVMTSTNSAASPGNPNITFNHTDSVPASFSQEYAVDDASLDAPTDAATTHVYFKPEDAKTFIMIPQTLGSDAKLKITFTNTGTSGGETTSPVFDADKFNGIWEPGYFYVYKLNLVDAIRVAISETCNDTGKSDVKFQNTSNVNEYIRATVVANWYDADANIVAPWTGGITPGSGWTESGGIYYYDSVVKTGEFTGNLFDSFTKPTTAPVAGAHFEMTILVQAVGSDGYSSCTAAF